MPARPEPTADLATRRVLWAGLLTALPPELATDDPDVLTAELEYAAARDLSGYTPRGGAA